MAVKAQKAAVRSRHPSKPGFSDGESKPSTIAAPAWLKDEGLKIWRRMTPSLTAQKLLTLTDRDTFARYCRNFARWLKMQEVLDSGQETYTVQTESGVVHRARPEFTIADRLERQLLAIEDRFGLNPAERQRIFVARSQASLTGDLFDAGKRRHDDAAAVPANPERPSDAPVGFLN
jgi:P27 family predicted phage terminase small subunit